jgi:hypothetical protein
VLNRVLAQAPRAIAAILRQVTNDIEHVLDVHHMSPRTWSVTRAC